MEKLVLTLISKCRDSKVTLTCTSVDLQQNKVLCEVSTLTGHASVSFEVRNSRFKTFANVVSYGENLVKPRTAKEFWLKVIDKLQERLKSIADERYRAFEFFEYQATNLSSTSEESFGSYFQRNKYGNFSMLFRTAALETTIVRLLISLSKAL